jgi:hypothetical protein
VGSSGCDGYLRKNAGGSATHEPILKPTDAGVLIYSEKPGDMDPMISMRAHDPLSNFDDQAMVPPLPEDFLKPGGEGPAGFRPPH